MKNILLFLLALIYSAQSFAQDPDLYQTWHLISYEYDLGPIFFVNNIQPSISPTIIIGQNLDYMGDAACNGYLGNFSFDAVNDLLINESFDATLSLCDYQDHDAFEVDYFGYFGNYPVPVIYSITSDTSGNMFLSLEFNAGYILNYQNFPLSIPDQSLVRLDIYPNPVSNELYISSDNLQVEKINIYSINGKEVMSVETADKSIDVSRLQQGVYFIEVTSGEGKNIQKFIKN